MYKETRMSEVKITDGLIYKKRNIVKEKTIPYIRKALNNELDGVEPSGAFETSGLQQENRIAIFMV